MTDLSVASALDPNLQAFRGDLADARLKGRVEAAAFVEPSPESVVAGIAPVYKRPSPEAEVVNHFHYGEAVEVFERTADFVWCRARFDDYVGYVRADQVAPAPEPAPNRYVGFSGGYVYADPELRREPIDFLPRHCAVAVADELRYTRDTPYAALASGGYVPARILTAERPRAATFVDACRAYLGVPYLWGGRSALGIDCTGLVQMAFLDLGVAVMRDTYMQRRSIGAAVPAAAAGDLRAGDLLYMPGHVVVYEGDGSIIHASGFHMTCVREPLADFLTRAKLPVSEMTVRRADGV
jgi:cell wall-associated NlpC family hydrolase